jgi:hypothetical protein
MTTPSTHTQARWFRAGYQEALKDISEALRSGGADAVQSWLESNMDKYEVTVTREVQEKA